MMARHAFLALLCVISLLSNVSLLASDTVRVDEAGIRLQVVENQFRLKINVRNALKHDVSARIDLEFVDPRGRVVKAFSESVALRPGSRALDIALPGLRSARTQDLPWLRLKYRLAPTPSEKNLQEVRGIVSLSETGIRPFVLKIGAPAHAVEGTTTSRIHVFAQDQASGRPVRGVEINGVLTVTDDVGKHILKATGRSNSSGYAPLVFELPEKLADPDATIEVQGILGDFKNQVSADIDLIDHTTILLSVDKPLYQPGQSLRVRALAYDASRKALANAPLELKLYDHERTIVFSTEMTTSRFGEAHSEWSIPENARLGDYFLEVGRGDAYKKATHVVKVTRYDLPNFTISLKADRAYYLPNQNAAFDVRAEYLFGRPVKRARVKVVQERSKRWNYRAQKYETEETEIVEGEAGDDGRFAAKFNLDSEHDKLSAANYERYQDLRYSVYVTDPTTARTEQRRFDLRISQYPIHIYATPTGNAEGLLAEFYISTFYADGSPAKSKVSIYERGDEGGPQLIRTIRTNRYGAAKITGISSSGDTRFLLTADDDRGHHGEHTETVWRRNPAVGIYPNKTLYRTGEPLEVELKSSHKTGPVVLDILQDNKQVESKVVSLRNGKAFVVIPYHPGFKDDLTLAAYFAGNADDYETYGLRRVAYPRKRGIKIEARVERATYAPGDEASIQFRTRSADGVPKQSVVGVVVLDKAIEERARMDSEFGARYSFCSSCLGMLGLEEQFSGLTRADLDELDLSRPLPEGMELAAEILLNSNVDTVYTPNLTEEDVEEAKDVFEVLINEQLGPLRNTLEEALRGGAPAMPNLNLEAYRDPWDNLYRAHRSVERTNDVLSMESSGPDEKFDSPDDFIAFEFKWPYFRRNGDVINKAVRDYHQRTRGFIRDLSTLENELAREGESFDSWRDPWGRPYRAEFATIRNRFVLTIRSGGPNGRFEESDAASSDDLPVWTSATDYTIETTQALEQAMSGFYQATKRFPETRNEFEETILLAGIAYTDLIDPWGNRYYPTFKTEHYYSNRQNVITYEQHLRTSRRSTVVPVTSKIQFVVLRSAGPDGQEDTSDDFDVSTVSRVFVEQTAQDPAPVPVPNAPVLLGTTGAIQGVVVDATGALIPGVTVTASSIGQRNLETHTGNTGEYVLRNLTAGPYEVRFELPGFVSKVIQLVPVQSLTTTTLSVTLDVASMSSAVEVRADSGVTLAMTSASIEARTGFSVTQTVQTSTPRLREYFPETLLWQPAIETDRSGKARINFKLADNITTWKMAAVASTVDGEIGIVEKEILSFQPFFIDHDPPRMLTQGDEIDLPVVVRSYLNKDQTLDLEVKEESWFAPLDTAARKVRIKAGEVSRETFPFRATTPAKDGKHRITAIGTRAGDAIEKPVTVRPDGREITGSGTYLLLESVTHQITIPRDALPGASNAEVKIYPNLMAHVVDGIEGIMRRPYGCAEQTISSAYPSLLLLRYYRENGEESASLAAKARRYLAVAHDKLLGYRTADGGFSYWGSGDADVAVTAYALEFLEDMHAITPVEQTMLRGAYQWLARRQRADGSWGFGTQQEQGNSSLTALVARALSRSDLPGSRGTPAGAAQQDAVARALMYLQKRTVELEEPYALASLALAALSSRNLEVAGAALARLARSVHSEGDAAYWDLQTNTPFYGWGVAGRLETTALAVRALVAGRALGIAVPDALADRGFLYLLRNKDRFGVWHSTQATVRVLDALTAVFARRPEAGASERTLQILVNGRPAGSATLPGNRKADNPTTVDLSRFIVPGENNIEVRGSGNGAVAVQFVENHYIPWERAFTDAAGNIASANAVRLAVEFDKTAAGIGDEITARVRAERVGFRGYGMMLAEIGLPPGADVDRSHLESVIKSAGWEINRYDVLPDRLIVYLWPRAGGIQFEFKFRVRYGLNAQTPPSTLYDYYNPEAGALLPPARFSIGSIPPPFRGGESSGLLY